MGTPPSLVLLPGIEEGKAIMVMLNVLDFAEQKLDLRLFPVQRVVLKLLYGLPLSREPGAIQYVAPFVHGGVVDSDAYTQWDWSEWGYVDYLHKQGRCNVPPDQLIVGHEIRELVLACGRRSGKTVLSGVVTAYELYRLMATDDPQAYYGLSSGQEIQLLLVGPDKQQVGYLLREVVSHVDKVPELARMKVNATQGYQRFQTVGDIRRWGVFSDYNEEAKATVKLSGRSAASKGMRGGVGNFLVVLDEMAFYSENGAACAEAVYNAVTPSVAAFTPKEVYSDEDGPCVGKIMVISSPYGKGMFYRLFRLGFTPSLVGQHMLCLRIPTWEMNPTIPVPELQRWVLRDERAFRMDYGAEFMPLDDPEDLTKSVGVDIQCPKCGHTW